VETLLRDLERLPAVYQSLFTLPAGAEEGKSAAGWLGAIRQQAEQLRDEVAHHLDRAEFVLVGESNLSAVE